MTEPSETSSGTSNDGAPAEDRRGDVLEPASGGSGRSAANIREQQGNHEGGMVPASYTGDGEPLHAEDDRSPEDAADHPDEWDSEG